MEPTHQTADPRTEALSLVRELKRHFLWQREQGWSGVPTVQSDTWNPSPLSSMVSPPVASLQQEPHQSEKQAPVSPSHSASSHLDMIRAFSSGEEAPGQASRSHAPSPSKVTERPNNRERRAPVSHSAPSSLAQERLVLGVIPPMQTCALLPSMSLQEEQRHFERIASAHARVQDCQRCPLSRGRKHLLYGEGPPRTRLMVVFPQPYTEEDQLARGWQSETGMLVHQMLTSIGVNPDEVYLAFHIKCRTPTDRHPLVKEVHTCLPYVIEQIQTIQPQVVLAMGAIVAQSLLGTNQRLEGLREKWFRLDEMDLMRGASQPSFLMASYHPLYLQKRPKMKRNAWQDMLRLREKLLALG